MEIQILVFLSFGDYNDPLSLATEQGSMRKYPIGFSGFYLHVPCTVHSNPLDFANLHSYPWKNSTAYTIYDVRIYTAFYETGLQVEKRLSPYRHSNRVLDRSCHHSKAICFWLMICLKTLNSIGIIPLLQFFDYKVSSQVEFYVL